MSRWDGPYSSAAFSLAKELAKNHQVFYIDNPFTIKDFITNFNSKAIHNRKEALILGRNSYKSIAGLPDNFIAVTPPLTLSINMLPKGQLYKFFLNLNNKIIARTVKKIIKDFGIKEYMFFNSYNPFYNKIIPNDYPPKCVVYQSRDDISESDYVSKHGVQLEREALNRADVCFATSKELCRILSTDSKKVYHLPNAADISIFKEARNPIPRPKELKGVTKKIIGYTGNVGLRIDYELIKKIAEAHKDKILLMVGSRADKKYTEINLDVYSNIIFTGAKNIHELPAYLHYMDCAVIPFVCNKLTASIYPLKVNEYLAAGKPVVSTNFSGDIAGFKNVIDLAENHEEFIDYIDQAIYKITREQIEKGIKVAENNTWEARVKMFWEIVEKLYPQKVLNTDSL